MADQTSPSNSNQPQPEPQANIFGVLKPYLKQVGAIFLVTLISSGLSLSIPRLIGQAIDQSANQHFQLGSTVTLFSLVIIGILVFAYALNIIQAWTAEKVARDLRHQLNQAISSQSYLQLQDNDPAKLLTNITSDVDNIKMFVAGTVSMALSSAFMLVIASGLLISINWKLGLAVLVIVPLIAATFALVFGRATALFTQAQEVIDAINRIVNQSILGSGLVRVLYGRQAEMNKFLQANDQSLSVGLRIVQLFAIMIPVVGFFANLATVIVLVYGGHLIIVSDMSLGDLASFNGYIGMIIWPIIMLGIMSTMLTRAGASYGRILQLINQPPTARPAGQKLQLSGKIEVKKLNLQYQDKQIIKDLTFDIRSGSHIAIIGPTAAGKSQLLNLLAGLIPPTSGTIEYDHLAIDHIDPDSFYQQVGLVFQDSSVFNLSIAQNIAFSQDVKPTDLSKAIQAAELDSFIASLPDGLETIISERGASLSGGQKQRLMLARALARNPRILLLDDFTARVDLQTEANIRANLKKLYPHLTILSVTQKVQSIADYNHILVLIEGELVAQGNHQQLLTSSPEYVQIYQSQQSLQEYEA